MNIERFPFGPNYPALNAVTLVAFYLGVVVLCAWIASSRGLVG